VQEVYAEHGYGGPSDEIEQNIRQAIDYYYEGNYEYAGKYLKRAENLLDS
jgi:hypothetical protein